MRQLANGGSFSIPIHPHHHNHVRRRAGNIQWRGVRRKPPCDCGGQQGFHFVFGNIFINAALGNFRDDFGGDAGGVIAHLARHAAPELRARLAGTARISGYFYDWALNDAR